MSTKVMSAPTLEHVKLNDGVVRPGEKPMFVGDSNLSIGGKRLRMSVTFEKEWFWLRFNLAGGQLPKNAHEKMLSQGWSFSKKKRLAYWRKSDESTVKFLRGIGYYEAKHMEAPAPAPVELVREDVEILPDRSTAHKTRTHKFVKNSAGRWMYADTGKLAKKADVLAWLEAQGVADETPEEKPVPVTSEENYRGDVVVIEDTADVDLTGGNDDEDEDAESIDYRNGYEDAAHEAEDKGAEGLYDRTSIARYLGMSVDELNKIVSNEYIQGFLDGFESIRPRPKVVGIKARIAEILRRARGK